MANIKPLEKRKRMYAAILQTCKGSLESASPERKRRKICRGRSLLKRPFGNICGKIPSPARKRMRMATNEEEQDTELPSHYKEAPSPVILQVNKRDPGSTSPERRRTTNCRGRSLVKRPYSDICGETPSPERKRMRMTTNVEEKELPTTTKEDPSPVNQVQLLGTKEEASTSQSDTRNSDGTSGKKTRNEDSKDETKVTTIWIIRSRNCGKKAASQQFGENFRLHAKVEWFGKEAMRWSGVLPRFHRELSTQSPPDILVVHAGGLTPAKELACQMQRELMQLHAEFPSMIIAYSCINEEQVWRNGRPGRINKERKTVNTLRRKAVGNFSGGVIEHPLLRFYNDSLFLPDGVHFSKEGNRTFVSRLCYC
ncbi:uncharacterized protein [Trachinotus anak]|uniref:uncharacterized protein isoform X2 n=1 Tax=Trachinotus anak TaxID=443729 RepID=UPI0039F19E03